MSLMTDDAAMASPLPDQEGDAASAVEGFDCPHPALSAAEQTWKLAEMDSAAAELLDCISQLAQSRRSVIHELVGDGINAEAWRHYPTGDAHAGEPFHYYYHCHEPGSGPSDEHGHFHVFAQTLERREQYSHLIALSLDNRGLPLRVFTTNRWVTGEHWLSFEQLRPLLQNFKLEASGQHTVIDRWLTSALTLFVPQIVEAVWRRDQRVRDARAGGRRPTFFEDRRTHVLSQKSVSVTKQIQRIDNALTRRA